MDPEHTHHAHLHLHQQHPTAGVDGGAAAGAADGVAAVAEGGAVPPIRLPATNKSSMFLTVLPYRLRVARVAKTHVPTIAHTLMKFMLFAERSQRFFSVTESPMEITMVIEERDVEQLVRHACVSIEAEFDWRAVQVCEGAAGFEEEGVIQQITGPLAQQNITMLFMSTFDTDYVLLEAAKLPLAVATLQHHFTVTLDEEIAFSPRDVAAAEHELQCKVPIKPHPHPIFVLPCRVRLAKINKGDLKFHAHQLLKLFMFPEEARLLSLTETEDEVSLVLPDTPETQDFLDSPAVVCTRNIWVPLQVGDAALGFSETGIVASQSAVLSAASVTMFYFSTYSTDFTLVRQDDQEAAEEALSRTWTIVQGHPKT